MESIAASLECASRFAESIIARSAAFCSATFRALSSSTSSSVVLFDDCSASSSIEYFSCSACNSAHSFCTLGVCFANHSAFFRARSFAASFLLRALSSSASLFICVRAAMASCSVFQHICLRGDPSHPPTIRHVGGVAHPKADAINAMKHHARIMPPCVLILFSLPLPPIPNYFQL